MKETMYMDPIYITATPPASDYTWLIVAGVLAVIALGFWLIQRSIRKRVLEAEAAFDRYQAALREEERQLKRAGGYTPPTRPSKVSPARFDQPKARRNTDDTPSYAPAYDPGPTFDSSYFDSGDSGSSSDCSSSDGGSCGDGGGGGD